MIRTIIGWSLRNPLIVLLGIAGLIAAGTHAALNLNIEAYPDPTPPLVEVISQRPGASPEEMERLVGIPIETALNGVPGIVSLRSVSIAGLNDIKCQFTYDTNYKEARQEVINRLAMVNHLPEGVKPRLSPWSPTGEIVRYVLEGPGYTTSQLQAVQDWVLNRMFKQVPGVIDVTCFGGTIKQYQVLLDPRLMRQYSVTMAQVEEAIDRSNANVGANNVSLGAQAHNVRGIGLLGEGVDPLDPANVERYSILEAEKLEDIEDVVISSHNGTPIFVRNIAKVVVGHQPRLGIVGRTVGSSSDNDVVEGIVLMRKYEKSLPTATAVKAKIEEINASTLLPKGMRIVAFNRRTDLVEVTTHNVRHNLLVGMGLVVAVLFVFLGDIASAAIVAIVIPLALLFAVLVLYLQGKSANLLSIGAVDFGIIVDSSVIIVETIYRHVAGHGVDRSRPFMTRILDAAGGVDRPILFSTLILVCAFFPLFVMSGPAGALFGPMANTYAFSILGALIVAVTLAPVLCSFFYRNKKEEKDTILDRALKWIYVRALRATLNHRWLALVFFAGLIGWSATLVSRLGAEFMPVLEEGNLWIRALMPRTTSLEEAARIAPRIREVIATVPEVRGVMSHVGRPDDGTDITSFFNLEFNVPLLPMEQWRKDAHGKTITREFIQHELEKKLERFPGVNFSFSQLIRDNVEEALSGVKGANSVKLFGGDLERLEEVAGAVANELRKVPGIENVGVFHIIGQPSVEITIDRQACARYGINVADVESVIEVAVGGRAFSQMVEGEKLYDIVLRLPYELRSDPSAIAQIPVEIPNTDGKPLGARVPLSQLTTIYPHKSGASNIYRENNRRYVPIKFSVKGRDLASAIADAKARVENPRNGKPLLPPGYSIEWSGEFAQMQAALQGLMLTVPVSIVLIMVLLYSMFGNVKDALIVMAGVVTAMMGGVWALLLTGTTFSISAAVGFISIFGVVVQNGVLLINDFNRMRNDGVATHDAVITGSTTLLRPVLMISLTAILGLLPAALATSIGSQAQRPLAIVVVGGMIVAMILPQFLIPVLYSFFPAKRPRGRPVTPAQPH